MSTSTASVPVASATRANSASSTAAGSSPIMTHRQILLVIVGLLAGMFLSSLGQTVFGTAIRTIGDDLHGLDQQAWVTTAYLITSTIATPIYGKLSDLFGRRPLFIFGIVVFIAGAILSSFSTSMLMLAGFRAIQGIGAGALLSLPLAILGDILAPRERAKYQGYFLAVFGIASVIGPLLGGLLAGTDTILFIDGWRWVLLINVPIGIAALILVIAFLHLPKVHDDRAKPRVDWWGATTIVLALVPLLLVAEQGRTWGWGSIGSLACYVIGAAGLVAFLLVERRMGTDAILPVSLFRSRTFSMASVLGFLVGFAMFGALLTLPLYLQIVTGLTPTEAGFATLPLVLGLMIASIVSGQIVARTGRYRAFPVVGTAVTAIGYLTLTFMNIDRPLWFLLIAMFLIGLGLGQLMQSLTMAAQNSVQPRDMGVATSSATFFRQIGGTLGVAILLSILFSALGGNVGSALANRTDLGSGLNAALNPAVADAPKNAGVMKQIWTRVVGPAQKQVDARLAAAGAQAVSAAGPNVAPQAALSAAAQKYHASVVDGTLAVDWSDAGQRAYWVGQLEPKIASTLESRSGASSDSASSASDTSFLNGADPRLTRPFLVGFNASTTTVYWVGFGVIVLAFVLSWFFKVPPLRQRSALQEAADRQRTADDLEVEAVTGALDAGSLVAPAAGPIEVRRP